jgi:cytochrome c-type biogenesis protein CcmH/NrfF
MKVNRLFGSKLMQTRVFRVFQVVGLAVALCFTLGATDQSARYNNLSHRMMCNCGCNELLGECSHVGCQSSTTMLRELREQLSGGHTDQEILAAFTDEYGATVLAAPTTKGFNLVVWIAPFALLPLGALGIILFIRKSGKKYAVAGGVQNQQATVDPQMEAMRERIRRETDEEGR